MNVIQAAGEKLVHCHNYYSDVSVEDQKVEVEEEEAKDAFQFGDDIEIAKMQKLI